MKIAHTGAAGKGEEEGEDEDEFETTNVLHLSTWQKIVLSGVVLMIVGIIATMIAVVVIGDEKTNNNLRRSIPQQEVRNVDSKSRPYYQKHQFKKHDLGKLIDVKDLHHKNHSRWFKLHTNQTHEGKNMELYIHVMLKEDLEMPTYKKATFGLNLDCLPPYTLGVNLSVPGAGYSIDVDSITQLNPIYAVNVINGAVSIWNDLGTLPVFGPQLEWDGIPDNLQNTDGKNKITFGSITPSSVLAYTIAFGFFGSFPINQRAIVEWGIVFGDASNTLCDAGENPSCFHYPAVAMHELGHALGLGDVYLDGCASQTVMFGRRSAGDVSTTFPQELDVIGYSYLYPAISYYALTNGTDLPDDTPGASSSLCPLHYIAILCITLAMCVK